MNTLLFKQLKSKQDNILTQVVVLPSGSLTKVEPIKYALSINKDLSTSKETVLDLRLYFSDEYLYLINIENFTTNTFDIAIDTLDYFDDIEFLETNALNSNLNNVLYQFTLNLTEFDIINVDKDDINHQLINIRLKVK